MDELKLKPCPFCGSEKIREDLGGSYVECMACATFGPTAREGEAAEEVWNRRVGEKSESRWRLLRKRSNSGRVLYVCSRCERVSTTPDKVCNAGCTEETDAE